MQIWIFSTITPVFSLTWSFRNHSNMLTCCSRNIWLLINVENSRAVYYCEFYENRDTLFGLCWWRSKVNKKKKKEKQHLFEFHLFKFSLVNKLFISLSFLKHASAFSFWVKNKQSKQVAFQTWVYVCFTYRYKLKICWKT